MAIRVGGAPAPVATARAAQAEAIAVPSKPQGGAVAQKQDRFEADGDGPSKAEVDEAYRKLTPEEKKKFEKMPANEVAELEGMDRKLAMKCKIRKGIMEGFKQMAEEQAQQVEAALNKLAG